MMRGFATFWGKHRIIAEQSGATSFLRSKYIISPQGDASFDKMYVTQSYVDCIVQNRKGKQQMMDIEKWMI